MKTIIYSLLVLSSVSLLQAAEKLDFAREILPILSDKCFACHGPDAKKKELRLDTYELATKDLGGYKAIDPENLEKSEVVGRLFDDEDPMPPEKAEKKLTKEEREKLVKWVKSGGKYATHWAYVPPAHQGKEKSIDEFIEQKLKTKKLALAKEADKATLARRASLVLTGLPPEPKQLDAYLKDTGPKAYEKLVDQLLASPKYGEHQARYWLDAVRYGDTHGLHLDNKRGIYPYRDWVIMALNDNMPLDQFITWQLAGDLMPNPSLEQLVATGYVRMNPSTAEGGVIPAEFQAKNNFDRVETLGTVFLGSSLICSRCHTHKYDPIPMEQYYQLMAFFNNTAENPLDGNKYVYQPTIKVPNNIANWKKWNELNKKREAFVKKHWREPSIKDKLRVIANKPQQQKKKNNTSKEAEKLFAEIDAIEKSFTTTLVAKELGKSRKTFLLKRGEYSMPSGDPLQPEVITIMGNLPDGAPRNRLGLAKWLTSRNHPTVTRVFVNRIWQRAFGYGLVRTPEEFGLQGEHPTHPELLDWLAIQLHEKKWDLKAMLKLIVSSNTFKQSSSFRNDIDDSDNKLYARGPSFRLDAEVLRDLGLWAGGILDPHMGGEGVKPYQPKGLWSTLMHPASNTKKYVQDKGKRLYRRSLYVYWKRTSPHPMLTLFDAPSRESSCVKRSRSNTPLQSLGLLNETQRIEMSRMLAEKLIKSKKDQNARLDQLFTLIACRKPSSAEKAACDKLYTQMLKRYQANQEDAKKLLSTGDMPRDAKLDLAEHAAWTQVATTVLASDIALLLY